MKQSGLVSPQEALAMRAGGEEVTLVCAYDDEANFQRIGIPGSVSFPAFQKQMPSRPKEAPVVFYCDCPHDELAREKSETFRRQGVNAMVLDGGVNAWAKADG